MALSQPSRPLTLLGDGLTRERSSALFRHGHIRTQRDVDLASVSVRTLFALSDNFIQSLLSIRAHLRLQLIGDNLGAVWVELTIARHMRSQFDRNGVSRCFYPRQHDGEWFTCVRRETRQPDVAIGQFLPVLSHHLQYLFQVGEILVPELQSRRRSGVSTYVVGIYPPQLHTSVVVTTKGEKMDAATFDLFLWRLVLLRGVDDNLAQDDLRLFPFNQV